jgi:hypothetical protein
MFLKARLSSHVSRGVYPEGDGAECGTANIGRGKKFVAVGGILKCLRCMIIDEVTVSPTPSVAVRRFDTLALYNHKTDTHHFFVQFFDDCTQIKTRHTVKSLYRN